jgi:hypothetical protein
MGGKKNELLFLFCKKWVKSPPSILVIKNLKWSQSLYKMIDYVYEGRITPSTSYLS